MRTAEWVKGAMKGWTPWSAKKRGLRSWRTSRDCADVNKRIIYRAKLRRKFKSADE